MVKEPMEEGFSGPRRGSCILYFIIYNLFGRHVKLAQPTLLTGQRQNPASWLRASQHAVVLWRRGVRGKGHQTHAELRENEVQTHQYR